MLIQLNNIQRNLNKSQENL